MPLLSSCLKQIGVKEIRHEAWKEYWYCFPDMKVLMTGRDPRDIYLSLYYRIKRGKGKWSGVYSPETVSGDLRKQFRLQLRISKTLDCLMVKYEKLCTKPEVLEKIKLFTESDIPGIGRVGVFNSDNPGRQGEYKLHGDQITSHRVARWRSELNEKLVDEAQETFDLMPDYCDFWGYEK